MVNDLKQLPPPEKKEDPNQKLKEKFLEYFAVLPIQKLAAEYIARSEDTITNWKKEDPWFSDQIATLKAEWARTTAKRVRNPEWLLERIMNDHFKPKSEVEHSGGIIIEAVKYGTDKDKNTV